MIKTGSLTCSRPGFGTQNGMAQDETDLIHFENLLHCVSSFIELLPLGSLGLFKHDKDIIQPQF